jgi:hypothetical protein
MHKNFFYLETEHPELFQKINGSLVTGAQVF